MVVVFCLTGVLSFFLLVEDDANCRWYKLLDGSSLLFDWCAAENSRVLAWNRLGLLILLTVLFD